MCFRDNGPGAQAIADALLEFNLGPRELYNLRHSAHWLDETLCNPGVVRSSIAALDMMKGICKGSVCFWRRAQPIPLTPLEFLMAHAIYAFPGIYFIDAGPTGPEREKMNEIQPRLYNAAKDMLLLFYDVSVARNDASVFVFSRCINNTSTCTWQMLYSLSSGKSASHLRRKYGEVMKERMCTYHATWTQARIVGEIIDLKALLVNLNESASPSEADDESVEGMSRRD